MLSTLCNNEFWIIFIFRCLTLEACPIQPITLIHKKKTLRFLENALNKMLCVRLFLRFFQEIITNSVLSLITLHFSLFLCNSCQQVFRIDKELLLFVKSERSKKNYFVLGTLFTMVYERKYIKHITSRITRALLFFFFLNVHSIKMTIKVTSIILI